MAEFALAIPTVLAHEGGLSDYPDDPGGVTNFGITARDHPSLGEAGVRALTREQAIDIYQRDFWEGRGYHRIGSQAVATKLLDMAVNMGTTTAVKLLQRALNYLLRKHQEVAQDGVFGPATVAAINTVNADLLVLALRAHAALRYIELVEGPDPRFESFSKNWLQRAME